MDKIVSRVGFDWRAFGMKVRTRLRERGEALRPLADRIGVTSTDLSRASSGTAVSIEKAFAIADWAGIDARDFYQPPMKSTRCTSRHVKQPEATT